MAFLLVRAQDFIRNTFLIHPGHFPGSACEQHSPVIELHSHAPQQHALFTIPPAAIGHVVDTFIANIAVLSDAVS
jgi:hypothetical protein